MSVADDFREVLEDLRNEKLIINNLTTIASQYRNNAQDIADVIASRVKEAPIPQRLPLLYLTDSIVKNIGEPYRMLFERRIYDMFCFVWDNSEGHTRRSLTHLRNTWGKIYPGPVLAAIDANCISGSASQHAGGAHVNPNFERPRVPPAQAPPPVHRRDPPPMQHDARHHPYSRNPHERDPRRRDPRDQGGGHHRDPRIPDYPDMRSSQPGWNQGPLQNYPPPNPGFPMPGGPYPPPAGPYGNYGDPGPYNQMPPMNNMMPPSSGAMPPPSVDFMQLIQSLSNVANNGGLPGMPPVMPPVMPPTSAPGAPYSNGGGFIPGMGGMGMANAVSCEFPDLKVLKNRDEAAVHAIYDAIKFQCMTCARRFHDEKELTEHMDWHFHKRKESEQKRAVSRMWYMPLDDWIADAAPVEMNASTVFGVDDSEGNESPKEKDVQADENYSVCPVCNEKFEQYWDDVDEEWMYKDSMYEDESKKSIVHQTCVASSAKPVGDLVAPKVETTGNEHVAPKLEIKKE